MCGQGWGVLILSPLLQTMIATLGWQNTYKIMASVVPVLRLSGFTYSPNVQIPDIDKNDVAEKDAEITSGGENPKEGQGRMERRGDSGAAEQVRMLVYIAVWKEPKFVATVMMFTHYVPQIHLMILILWEG